MKKTRHRNGGLRKVCGCPRRQWPKCPHSWYLNYKPRGPRGGPSYRLSLDAYVGKHVAGKTEAAKVANGIKAAIDAGTFRTRREQATPTCSLPEAPDAVTFWHFGETYLARRGKPATSSDVSHLRRLAAFELPGAGTLGDKPLGAITEDDVELFFVHLRQAGRAASTRNKYVQVVKAMFRWAVRKKYLTRNPVADSEAIRREKHAKRDRRLAPDVVNAKTAKLEREGEERLLLAVAGPHLQRVVVAALETGCRRGELLSLEWRDVDLQRRELTVRAATTKTKTARVLPISDRLAGVLEMAQSALAATLFADRQVSDYECAALLARCHVFGDSAGRKVANIKKAWETAVLRAHGVEPAWTKANKLTPESRSALAAIDLHFHDLRHEAGSRLIEAGWPIHHVSEMLGHASLEQTSTYLNVTRVGLHESMRRFDVNVARCKPVANEPTIEHRPVSNGGAHRLANTLLQ
ncbi:MAG: tyrosine-type recombinase/integrase [Vicinamibacterales bacterium]